MLAGTAALCTASRVTAPKKEISGLRPRPPDELPELLRQLSGMAVNINQIAKVANARGFVRMEDIDRIKAMQGLLWRTMKRL